MHNLNKMLHGKNDTFMQKYLRLLVSDSLIKLNDRK